MNVYASVGMLTTKRDPKQTINAILDHYGYTLEKVKEKGRKQEVVTARMVCICALYFEHKWTLKKVGEYFNRDHTTMVHSIQRIRNLIDTEPDFKEEIKSLSPKTIENIHKKRY